MSEEKHLYRLVGEEGVLLETGRIPEAMFFDGNRSMNTRTQAVSSFTIHVAPAGSRVVDDFGREAGNSLTGHVFISARQLDFNTGTFKTANIGLSPGADWRTNKDNLSFNDAFRYPDASSMTVEGSGFPHHAKVGALFGSIMDYQAGKKAPPNYNLLAQNCIQFAQDLLGAAGIKGIKLALTPNGVQDNLEHSADNYVTPLILDLNGDGVHTLQSNSGVGFDFDGQGHKSKTGWASPEDGLLVLDRNGDGIIDTGSELFGSNSLVNAAALAKDGFEALAFHDSNKDGLINADDAIWTHLQVWQDRDSDGVSQQQELFSLDTLGIVSLSLNATPSGLFDGSGNIRQLISSIEWSNGTQTELVDVLLHQQPTFEVSNQSPNRLVTDNGVPCELVGQSAMPETAMGFYLA